MLNTIDEGIKAVRQGKIVIVVDDENRENEGDFIVSGEKITPDIVNFMITHGRGLLCVPLPRSRCEELQLYPMSEDNTFGHSVHHVCRPEGLRLYNGGFCL